MMEKESVGKSSLPQGHSLPFCALAEPRGHPASAPGGPTMRPNVSKLRHSRAISHLLVNYAGQLASLPHPPKTPELQGERMGLAGLILLSTVLGSAEDEPIPSPNTGCFGSSLTSKYEAC